MQAGKGLAVIDPHGDLFHELLQLIPEHRWDDVVLLDPTDIEFPVGLNFLECRKESERHFVVRQMKAIIERLTLDQYGAASTEWMGPSFFQHMQMNRLLVMSDSEHPGTLLEFYELFQHKEFWKRWLPLKWSDQMLERWVAKNLPGIDYTHRPKGETSCTFGEYLSTKFDDFVFDPRLRRMFGQRRSTIDFRTIMDEGKILLVNLAKGDLSEANSRFLGMALMARIQAAAMSRISLPPEKRRTFYLYVDEFQSLATENFLVMLSEARKFGVGLVLANQFVSQIKDERIMQSVFGNAGTVVSFRVGQEDAQILEPRFTPHFDRFDLTNLPNWQACVKATVDGNVTTPFTLHTLPPPQPTNPRQPQRLRKMSRKKYAKPRDQVDFEIVLSLSPDRSLPAGVVPPEGMLELQNVMSQSREPTEDDVDHEREEGDDSPQDQGPPPPPPGVDATGEMGFDDEDLRVLASVGDYRFGSIMDSLTTDRITISESSNWKSLMLRVLQSGAGVSPLIAQMIYCLRGTPKTGPGNEVVFLNSILGGARWQASASHTV